MNFKKASLSKNPCLFTNDFTALNQQQNSSAVPILPRGKGRPCAAQWPLSEAEQFAPEPVKQFPAAGLFRISVLPFDLTATSPSLCQSLHIFSREIKKEHKANMAGYDGAADLFQCKLNMKLGPGEEGNAGSNAAGLAYHLVPFAI